MLKSGYRSFFHTFIIWWTKVIVDRLIYFVQNTLNWILFEHSFRKRVISSIYKNNKWTATTPEYLKKFQVYRLSFFVNSSILLSVICFFSLLGVKFKFLLRNWIRSLKSFVHFENEWSPLEKNNHTEYPEVRQKMIIKTFIIVSNVIPIKAKKKCCFKFSWNIKMR